MYFTSVLDKCVSICIFVLKHFTVLSLIVLRDHSNPTPSFFYFKKYVISFFSIFIPCGDLSFAFPNPAGFF